MSDDTYESETVWLPREYNYVNFILAVVSVGLIGSILISMVALKYILRKRHQKRKRHTQLARRRKATEYLRPPGMSGCEESVASQSCQDVGHEPEQDAEEEHEEEPNGNQVTAMTSTTHVNEFCQEAEDAANSPKQEANGHKVVVVSSSSTGHVNEVFELEESPQLDSEGHRVIMVTSATHAEEVFQPESYI